MRKARAGPLTPIAFVLLAADLVLLAVALVRGDAMIRDGAASVTSGNLVAWGILLTLAAVLGLHFVRLPPRTERHAQVFALSAQFLHSMGHLAGFYYTFRAYDDALHAFLVGWVAIVCLGAARAWNIIPARQVTPMRAVLIVAFAGIALSGVWELFEYGSDVLFASREQDNLDDTMDDMLAGAVGTLAACLLVHRREQGRLAQARPQRDPG